MFRRSPRHRCDYIQDKLVKVRRETHARLEKGGGTRRCNPGRANRNVHRYTASNGREIVKIPIVKSGYLCSERERERESLISNRSKFPTSSCSRILVTEITDPLVEQMAGLRPVLLLRAIRGSTVVSAPTTQPFFVYVDRFDAKFVVVDDQRCS